MVKALVFLAQGFEEVEATTIVDVLRRAGVDVTVAGLSEGSIEGDHGMSFTPDVSVDKVDSKEFDALVCPGGGPGHKNLKEDRRVIEMLREAFASGSIVAAVCASPSVLSKAGLLEGKNCTIYPGMEEDLEEGGGIFVDEIVVVDGNIITSKGPATALPFALKVAEKLVGREKASEVASRMLVDRMGIEY